MARSKDRYRPALRRGARLPYTLHPTPYTLHPTPYAPHPTPYAPHPTPFIPQHTPHTLHPTPCTPTLHPTPHTLHPTPYAPHPLHPTPYTPTPEGRAASSWYQRPSPKPVPLAALASEHAAHPTLVSSTSLPS